MHLSVVQEKDEKKNNSKYAQTIVDNVNDGRSVSKRSLWCVWMMVLLALSSCKKSIIDALQPTEALLRYNKITSGTKMCSLNFHSMEFTYFGLMRRKKVWFARQTLALIAFCHLPGQLQNYFDNFSALLLH